MRISSTIRRSTQVNRLGQAVRFPNRTRNWTEFGARIARLASGLVGVGVKPGDRVAMLALNSDRYLEYFFAVPWAGAVSGTWPIRREAASARPVIKTCWTRCSGPSAATAIAGFTVGRRPALRPHRPGER